MKLRTRVEEPADAPAVRRVHMAAFPGPEEADLVDALRRDPAWLPGLSVVAVDGGGLVVAHALLTRLRIGRGKGLALAPVAVAPEWQRRGWASGWCGPRWRRPSRRGAAGRGAR